MSPEPETVSSVRESTTVPEQVADWVLINGDRRIVAGILAVVSASIVWVLVAAGVLAVGVGSSVATVFGSGLTSGLVTLLTIALSINQLVLSRVFGSVNVLVDRLEGSRELRETVESIADVSSSPNDPADFLSLIAATLTDRVRGVIAASDDTDWDPPATVTDSLHDIVAYGESLDSHLESNANIDAVLSVILGEGYALNMTAVKHLQNEYEASTPEAVLVELDSIERLLESVAVVRQFYKTIAIQRDLATLSRLLVYSGLTALMTTLVVALIYRTNSITLPVTMLPIVVSVAIGIIVAPLALFVAYILRAATVARHTVSVGPFIPPQNRR
jgi:hypothetical protein